MASVRVERNRALQLSCRHVRRTTGGAGSWHRRERRRRERRTFVARVLRHRNGRLEKGDQVVLPKRLARINRVLTNNVLGPLSGRVPGFGRVLHTGRRSGRTYRTPVNVFHSDSGFVVALTYGKDTDWVRNVLAAGGCELETTGQRVRLTAPRIVHDESHEAVPALVSHLLGLVGVTDFLYLDRVD